MGSGVRERERGANLIFSAESRAYDFWGMFKGQILRKGFEGLDVGIVRVGGLFWRNRHPCTQRWMTFGQQEPSKSISPSKSASEFLQLFHPNTGHNYSICNGKA